MAQYSACPVETPRLPEWARQLERRTWRSKEDLSKISAQAKEELPRLALIPKVWCALVSLVLLSFLFVVALQYAGMVEIQYELNRRENELARLNHQKVEMALKVEQLSSLERVEREARLLGMEYPANLQVVKVVLPHDRQVQMASVNRRPAAR